MKRIAIFLLLSPFTLGARIASPLAYSFENSTLNPITVSVEGVSGLSMIIDPSNKGTMQLEPGQQITITQPHKTAVGTLSRTLTVQQPGSYCIGIDAANNLQAITQQKGIWVGAPPLPYI